MDRGDAQIAQQSYGIGVRPANAADNFVAHQ
jgi:hypothetical protein